MPLVYTCGRAEKASWDLEDSEEYSLQSRALKGRDEGRSQVCRDLPGFSDLHSSRGREGFVQWVTLCRLSCGEEELAKARRGADTPSRGTGLYEETRCHPDGHTHNRYGPVLRGSWRSTSLTVSGQPNKSYFFLRTTGSPGRSLDKESLMTPVRENNWCMSGR